MSESETTSTKATPAAPAQESRWLFWAIALTAAIGVYLYANWPQPPASPAAFEWQHDLDAAMKQGTEENRLVLVDFYATWCGPCKMMDRKVFPEQDVADALANWIPVKIDGDKNRDLVGKYRVRGYPTFLAIAPDGEVIDGFAGAPSKNEFVQWIKTVEKKWLASKPQA